MSTLDTRTGHPADPADTRPTVGPAGDAPVPVPEPTGPAGSVAGGTAAAEEARVEEGVLAVTHRAREAGRVLAVTSRAAKDAALLAVAQRLVERTDDILAANARDIARGRERGLAPGLLDRLRLDEQRLASIADAVHSVAGLPDPVGDVVRGSTLPNGIRLTQQRVPLGVVGIIYEARPNVTVDVAVLALKSGNAVVLRGGSAAAESNRVLVAVVREAVASAGLPPDSVLSIDEFGRAGARVLMRARGDVDVLIPRGGAELIRTVVDRATVPVIETGTGNVHIVLDASADAAEALPIVLNSKTQRPSVCNAAETLLVHRDAAPRLLAPVVAALRDAGVTVHGDPVTLDAAGGPAPAADGRGGVVPATDDDWAREYLSLDMAVRVVDSLDDAIAHIRRYSSGHTEAIVTSDLRSAQRFTAEVDAAAVTVNASTRFTDGGEFGLGTEVGISTQKLHARGPMGLAELTTTKWIVLGTGQIRE